MSMAHPGEVLPCRAENTLGILAQLLSQWEEEDQNTDWEGWSSTDMVELGDERLDEIRELLRDYAAPE